MDRKSIIILLISFVVLMAWYPLTNTIWPPKTVPLRTNQVVMTTNQVTGTNAPSLAANTNNARAPFLAPTNTAEETLVFTNESVRYTFTSHGGGIKLVELLKYPETVDCRDKTSTKNLASLNTGASLPVLALTGSDQLQGDGIFRLEKTATGIRALKQLPSGLLIEKDFSISSNYLINVILRLSNSSGQPLSLPSQEWNIGTSTPMGINDSEQFVGISWYDGKNQEEINDAWFLNKTLGCFPGTPRTLYQAGASNVVWATAHNQFFTLALMPKEPALQIVAQKVNLPRTNSPQPNTQQPFGIQSSVVYPAATLAPNQTLEKNFTLFGGPKENRLLEKIAFQYKNNIDQIMGYSGFFGWFAKVLLWAMNTVHSYIPSYAAAIIIITVIIKSLFWPLTAASTRSMKRMQELQPQMKALQEKYKDDPTKMNRKLMEFMRENKVSPLGGCLPMLLQIPVFFGFYRMIQSAIELRGAEFLWACDLSKPDTIFVIPGVNWPVNPLPLIMGATMLWQARLTPPSPGMDPMQQKIMKYMPLMFLFILYNFSAGLTLYWTVQNLLTIAQMKLTRSRDDKAGPKSPPAPLRPPKKKK